MFKVCKVTRMILKLSSVSRQSSNLPGRKRKEKHSRQLIWKDGWKMPAGDSHT